MVGINSYKMKENVLTQLKQLESGNIFWHRPSCALASDQKELDTPIECTQHKCAFSDNLCSTVRLKDIFMK